jgi:hypothetical protein
MRVIVMALIVGLTGWSSQPRLNAVPERSEERAAVLGHSDLRYWSAPDVGLFVADAERALERERTARAAAGDTGPLPPANFLAVSGVGEIGAFGASLLVGWTAAGTRRQLKAVTGVSTSVLTAPFAFLGPDYDDGLRAIYTQIPAEDVLTPRHMTAAIFEDATRLPLTGPFDTDHMRQLFDVGYELGRGGCPWRHAPPGYTAPTPSPAAVEAAS